MLSGRIRAALAAMILFSLLANFLALTGVIFTLQVYDRVLTGRSVETLIVLGLLAGGFFIVQGVLSIIRERLADRIGQRILIEHETVMLKETADRRVRDPHARSQSPIQDLDAVVAAVRGPTLNAALNLPWSGLFLIALWAIEPLLGLCGLISVSLLVLLSLVVSWLRPKTVRDDDAAAAQRAWEMALLDLHGPVAAATQVLSERVAHARSLLRDLNKDRLEVRQNARGVVGTLRQLSQIAVLAAGAWLVINGRATIGIMMASVILMGRIFAPVEAVLRERGAIIDALKAWRRLRDGRRDRARFAAECDPRSVLLDGALRIDRLAIAPTRNSERIVSNVSFMLEPGQLLVITGGSGLGKSLLLRTLAGLHTPVHGTVRLGDLAYGAIGPQALERLIGYLPQENIFLPGTIAEAIGRHDPSIRLADIVAAAKQVDLHERILMLRESYHTRLPPEGTPVSHAFARSLGIARAICSHPKVLLLDDPLAGFDAAGLQMLTGTIQKHRSSGGMCVVAANPPAFLNIADKLLVLGEGKVAAYGPPASVFKPRAVRPPQPLEKVGGDRGVESQE